MIIHLINIMINIQPVLFGKLVKIRPMLSSDFQGLYKAASDPLIWQQHPDPRRSEKQYFRQKFFNKGLESKGCLIFEDKCRQIIGSSRYYDYQQNKKEISIGYTFLIRRCWGHSFNRQIKHIMMNHIYQWVNTVILSVGANNKRSQIAVGKIGGVLISSQEQWNRKKLTNQSIFYQIKKQNYSGLI